MRNAVVELLDLPNEVQSLIYRYSLGQNDAIICIIKEPRDDPPLRHISNRSLLQVCKSIHHITKHLVIKAFSGNLRFEHVNWISNEQVVPEWIPPPHSLPLGVLNNTKTIEAELPILEAWDGGSFIHACPNLQNLRLIHAVNFGDSRHLVNFATDDEDDQYSEEQHFWYVYCRAFPTMFKYLISTFPLLALRLANSRGIKVNLTINTLFMDGVKFYNGDILFDSDGKPVHRSHSGATMMINGDLNQRFFDYVELYRNPFGHAVNPPVPANPAKYLDNTRYQVLGAGL